MKHDVSTFEDQSEETDERNGSEKGSRKLLDQVRDRIRAKHYSIRTEQSYIDWIKRYILFHNKRHPAAQICHPCTFVKTMAAQACWSQVTIFERYRSCWGIRMFRQQ